MSACSPCSQSLPERDPVFQTELFCLIIMGRHPDPRMDQYLYLTNAFYRRSYFGSGSSAPSIQKPLNDIFDRYRGKSTSPSFEQS